MRRLGIAFSLLFLLLVCAGYYTYSKFRNYFQSPGSLSQTKILVIPPGKGLAQIANLLVTEGVIKDSFAFYWGVRLQQKGRQLKAGEYEFPAAISPKQVVDLLISGKVYQHKITIPEGLTTDQILKEIKQSDILSGPISNPPMEGSLLPETYLFMRGDTRQALIERMQKDQNKILDQLWQNRSSDCPFKTKKEAIILASIVEKETALPKERPLIAAVFLNRLQKGMLLQSDPTVTYLLHKQSERPLNQALTKMDLKIKSPYNTYVYKGLPPGPICNPGKASLKAVFHPAPSQALYFVADGSGGHVFSTSLKEHQKNHRKWRKIRLERLKIQRAEANKDKS